MKDKETKAAAAAATAAVEFHGKILGLDIIGIPNYSAKIKIKYSE
eukprot:CAMPEP_0181111762 /NCGR_PEP_ID=MMETSP1071-20121207/19449_1 /TAXON_ID=35127 /ORGANISM="Thalassiosira sp., Strain NH16" /LENGTH=44 /DNA_ID= /DNA_START= /DNA_END= /DNA_ORIENTATION=